MSVDLVGLFLTMLRASTLSLGGQGALPLIRQEFVTPGIVSDDQVVEALTIGKLSTGPNGLWMVSIGYFAASWLGAALALLAVTLPPIVVIPAATYLRRQLLSPWFAGVVRGTTMATGGLVVATTVLLMFPGGVPLEPWQFALAALGTFTGVEGRRHPALVVGVGALAGLVLAH